MRPVRQSDLTFAGPPSATQEGTQVASFAAVGRNGHQLHPAGRKTRVRDHETNRCDGGSNELRMDAGSTRRQFVLIRRHASQWARLTVSGK